MWDFGVAGLVLLLVLASSGAGQILQPALHEHHKSRETIDAPFRPPIRRARSPRRRILDAAVEVSSPSYS